MTVNPMSIGYGPRARLLFDGDENQYDLWEVRFLGYLQLQGLKSVVLSTDDTIDADKNERVFSEMVQVLDEKSLCLIMNDAADDGRAALKILSVVTTRVVVNPVCLLCTLICATCRWGQRVSLNMSQKPRGYQRT